MSDVEEKKKTEFNFTQFELAYPEGIESHYWQKARAKILFDTLSEEKINHLSFLEIGCGKGTVIRLLRKKGIEIKGVELADINPDEEVKEFIESGKNALDLDAELRNSIDGILLLDVIEHIKHPIKFVKEIMDNFPNANYLLITVPARQELWSNYDEFYGHFKRYEIKDFQAFQKIDFYPKKTKYFFHSLYLAARSLMQFQEKRNIQIFAPKGFSKFIHRFLAFGFVVESKLIPSKVYGSSLLSLLKKDIQKKV